MSSSHSRSAATDHHSDEALLHRLGYAQVLYREMGGFSNFAISFTIISILSGCLNSYYIGFWYGGPVAITWGWLLVGVFCVLVALALGEIASSMPTAGALYFWASKLGGAAWGWFTGWFNLIGQIAVTAAIEYGAANIFTALFALLIPGFETGPGTVFIVFTVLVALHIALNMMNVNLLAQLNSFSAWWHMVGVAIIVVICLIVPSQLQSPSYVFGEIVNNSGFPGDSWAQPGFWFVFGLGLLMAQYTITGFDASAHMSEETRSASRSAAIGMIMSVVVSVVFGFILLTAITFAIPDTQGVIDAGVFPVPYIWETSLGQSWALFLLVIAAVAQFFCGTASVTSASRMLFAFSRDRAVPGSQLWRTVSNNRVPYLAVLGIGVLAWLLMLPTLINSAIGYLVGTSIAVVGLYISMAIPIFLRIRAGDRFQRGAWSLGKHYKWIAPVAVIWILFVCVLFMLPVSPDGVPGAEGFDWTVVNYSPLTVGAVLLVVGGWYLLSARKWFTGPIREAGSDAELAEIERELEQRASQRPSQERA
jgi:amino acid transporter